MQFLSSFGMCEGMLIALFAIVNLPEEELAKHPIAHKNCELRTFRGQNLQAFFDWTSDLCDHFACWIVARITTSNVKLGQGQNVFGVPDGLQNFFFNTGRLGAVILLR